MKLKKFVSTMQSIEKNRQLSEDVIIEALKEALEKAVRKHVGIDDAKFRVDVNKKSSEIRVFQLIEVVDEDFVEDANKNKYDEEIHIYLSEAKKINQNIKVGDFIEKENDIAEFGRQAVIQAKNVMKQKIREAEKQAIYNAYIDQLYEMVNGTVETIEENHVLVNLGRTFALLLKQNQIPNETYTEGQPIKVVITKVDDKSKGSIVSVSRTDATLVKRLFEVNVPEIYEGIVEIKAIAREAGERTKIAVYSHNPNIDPIGSCIGPKGQRVQAIIDELKGEKIDIFQWSEDITELIKNSLSPAGVLAVIPNPNKAGLLVVVEDNQLSLAIGKRGKNARLAYKLTGNKIDIKSESELKKLKIDWKEIALKQREEAKKEEEEKEEKAVVEEVQVVNEVVETTTETDIEKAARIAKENRANKVIEKNDYVSKFEELADASNKKVETKKSVKTKKDDSEKEEISQNIEAAKTKFNATRVLYTEEELAEIEERELAEENKSWIYDDDIDQYSEYDDLYDAE